MFFAAMSDICLARDLVAWRAECARFFVSRISGPLGGDRMRGRQKLAFLVACRRSLPAVPGVSDLALDVRRAPRMMRPDRFRSCRLPVSSMPRTGAAPRLRFRPPSIRKAMVRWSAGITRTRAIRDHSLRSANPSPWRPGFAVFFSPRSIARAKNTPCREPLVRISGASGRSPWRNLGKRLK